jgi:tetratricopeptide (TPR) repeat protein
MGEITGEMKDKIETVESLLSAQDYDEAIDLLLDVIDFFVEIGDFENRDKYLNKLDQCHRFLALELRAQKDFFEAAEIYCSAAFRQKEHDKNEIAYQLFYEAIDCFVSAGRNALSESSFKEASVLFCSAAKYAKTELQDKSKSNEYYNQAIEAMKQEINNGSNLTDPSIQCKNQLDFAEIHEKLENYSNAHDEYKKVIEFSIEKGLFSYTAEGYQHMSNCYELLGDLAAKTKCLNSSVHYRLLEAEKFSNNNLPLEAVQNFIAAANCISRLQGSDELLKNILQNEANCFMRAAQLNVESGRLLQAAYYERNAAYCYNRLGRAEASIDLLLTAAEKLMSVDEYYGAASNYRDVSLYLEQIGNLIKAADYALKAALSAKQSGDFEFAVENFKRAINLFDSIHAPEKVEFCNNNIAECYADLAEINFESDKFHFAAFLHYQAAGFYFKTNDKQNMLASFERALDFYESAIELALSEDEALLASYSTCCATLVCLLMQNLTRAESLLNKINDNPSNHYYQLSNSVINGVKTKNQLIYHDLEEHFSKIIQNSPEIKNMLEMIKILF